MPVKQGERRGRYGDGTSKTRTARVNLPAVLVPTKEDVAWMRRIIAKSTLEDADTKTAIAESCLTLRLLLRDFRSGRQLTAEETGQVGGVAKKLGDELTRLKLTEREVDPDEDEDDED
jgi:hypothetical protein